MSFYLSKGDVALYVAEELSSLKPGSALTMTIRQEPSEDYSVRIVTEGSSDATEQELAEQSFCNTQVNI